MIYAKPVIMQDHTGSVRLDKRSKIIEAAAACFLRLGYAETSLDDIVSSSGVVKQTIYNYFDNKDAVFKVAIEHLLSGISLEFNPDWYQLPPKEFFQKVAKLQLKTLAEPTTTAFLRLLVQECRRFPELQHIYAESIPQPFIDFVRGYIISTPHFANGVAKQVELMQAAVWCFRAAITGFATLSNLAPLLRHQLPNKTSYLDVIANLFATYLSSPDSILEKSDKAIVQSSQAKNSRAANSEIENSAVENSSDESAGSIEAFLEGQLSSLGPKKLVIIAGAIRVFSDRGYADASMEEVAKIANVSKQTVYKHFRSKNYLYAFIAKCLVGQLQSLPLPLSSLSLSEYLREYSSGFVTQSRRLWMREYFRLVLGESQAFPLESGTLLLYIMDHGREQLEAKIRESFSRSDASADDALSLSIAFRSILGGFVLLSQIFVVSANPFLTGESLIEMNNALLASVSNPNPSPSPSSS